MKLGELGERKIVNDIIEKFSIPYDDCAFIDMNDEYLLITTDIVYEKTHFPMGVKPYHIGWYSIAVNISDIASKGGELMGFVSSIALPRNTEKDFLDEILNGMEECMKKYGGKIVGGDTKEADLITIAITAFGKVKKDEAIRRKGARVGDAVYVTGWLGRGASLLQKNYDELLIIHPRIKEGRILAKSKNVSCCMDISDGLASSLYQLMKINNVGFQIYASELPLRNIAKTMENPLEYALYHGGDYELLFTLPEEKGERIERKIACKKIGEVIEENKIYIVEDGDKKEMENRGYEHFSHNKNY
ncbi:MAG: thiamine-phosphate kinase [Thermoplasmata archaeon]|nr:MAG: thiamine-phosphate kinase [Thermoplasmata archaeon]